MGRILIIDDDPAMLELERLFLLQEGYEVLIANDAQMAFGILKVYDIDLVICDVMMPDINGFQFASMMRHNPEHVNVKLAFVTSKKEKQDVLKAVKLGADFYVTKPIKKEDFLKKVNQHFKNNPENSNLQVHLHNPQASKARIELTAYVASITDLGVEILTSKELELDEKITVASSLFYEIPLKQPILRVLWTRKEKNYFRVGLAYEDINLEDTRKIQKWIAFKNNKVGQ